MEYEHLTHTFGPVFDGESRILILGSFPSVKSRESNFYYGHPQNRFWKVMAGILGVPVPGSVEEKRRFLLGNHIALWDVIASCDIAGSSDSSIKNVTANDMEAVLGAADIRAICLNGGKAYELFVKYAQREGQPPAYRLPSTSPANAAWGVERLRQAWGERIAGILMPDGTSRRGHPGRGIASEGAGSLPLENAGKGGSRGIASDGAGAGSCLK